ncbi:hypothetical protein AMTR_s00046p00212960 [Amborella trichopoda]|uniref:Uncharacterized protein n=1 Tax=Amborella trichopoda TaxID=13333 RepID=U5CXM2_AMBTC|nr:hypothetical protein AMTR_s00046p00212960 [Amborella trichopoda]
MSTDVLGNGVIQVGATVMEQKTSRPFNAKDMTGSSPGSDIKLALASQSLELGEINGGQEERDESRLNREKRTGVTGLGINEFGSQNFKKNVWIPN